MFDELRMDRGNEYWVERPRQEAVDMINFKKFLLCYKEKNDMERTSQAEVRFSYHDDHLEIWNLEFSINRD